MFLYYIFFPFSVMTIKKFRTKFKAHISTILLLCLFMPAIVHGENVIENSSFEVGAGHGWGLSGLQKYPLKGLIDSTTAAHGTSSVKLPYYLAENAQNLVSKLYRLKPGKPYTISFYAKSNQPNWAPIAVKLVNGFYSPYGPGDSIQSPAIMVSGDWKRYSFSGLTTPDTDKCSYQLAFYPGMQGAQGKYIWIDAVQLEEGTLTEYSPEATVELGLLSDSAHEANIFFEDEQAMMTVVYYNNDSQPRGLTTNYEMRDYYNKKVKGGSFALTVPAQTSVQRILDLTPPDRRTGAFRALLWFDAVSKTMEEVNLSVLPRPRTMNLDENSIFGAHIPFSDYFLSAMQRVGLKWNRTLSTGRQFRWIEIEPTRGSFDWKDDEIQRAIDYGFTVLGTLGSEVVHVPSWAKDENGLPKLNEWDHFVYSVVSHYKDLVKYWEIWNEPDTEGGLGGRADFYGQLLKTAYGAAKRADSNCTVVGMAAYYSSYVEEVFQAVGHDCLDVVSTHRYPPVTFSHFAPYWDVIRRNGDKPVWNTETGLKTDSFYQSLLWEDLWISYAQPSDWGRDYRLRTEKQLWNFAHSCGNGFKKYIYYDARATTAPNFLIAYSLFEYDGTLKPKAVALSVLANLFHDAESQGEISVDPESYAYLFKAPQDPVIILWTKDWYVKRRLTIALPPAQVSVFDLMGNEVEFSGGIMYGRSPLYLKGTGITSEQLLSSLSISNATDTEPPNLSIVTWPTGPTDGDRVLLRWFAVDDVSVSTRWETTPHSILYSYRLEGLDTEWSAWDTAFSKTYLNLNPGNYTFSVKAKDEAGNISPTVTKQFKIGISPPKDLKIVGS